MKRTTATRTRRALRPDLGGDAVHPGEARHDVEHALAGAVRDVGLELRAVVDQVAAAARGAKRLLGRRIRRRQPHCRLGRVAAVVAEQAGDPAGHVAVVERERALDPRAEDRDVVPVRTRRLGHRGEIEERRDQDALAALGSGDDRPRAVRRGHGEDRRAHRQVLAGRVAEVEPVDQHAEALAAERDAALAASARASSTSAAHQTRSYPLASAWQIVDVARITSITTPVGAAAASSGVKAT